MLNKIIIMGRLVRDPEMRRTQSGHLTASFSLAVERDYSGEDGNRQADFIQCIAWRHTAEFVQKYFKKGSMAVVTGRLTQNRWTDSDGVKRSTMEVNAENVYFGESKAQEKKEQQSYSAPSFSDPYGDILPEDYEEIEDENLPF